MESLGLKNIERHISLMAGRMNWVLSMQISLWQHELCLVSLLNLVVQSVGPICHIV